MVLILLALAISPGIAIAVYVHWRDRFDKEPRHLLIISFILGVVSIIPAIFLEKTYEEISHFLFSDSSGVLATALSAFMGVAFVEEFCKYFFLRIYTYRKNAFNEPFDGITYAVMVSMGFATFENILYVLQGGLGVAVLRMFLSVPAHATFAIVMGYFVGLAKFKKEEGHSIRFHLIGLFVATLFHGMFDFFLFLKSYPLLGLGAIISFSVGLILSLQAMDLHSKNSPFRKTQPICDPNPTPQQDQTNFSTTASGGKPEDLSARSDPPSS